MAITAGELDLVFQSKEYFSKQLNAQVCKNWYQVLDKDGKYKQSLFPFPGSRLWANDGGLNHSVRGLFSLNGTMYGVIDNEFRIYNDNGDFRKVGTLNTSIGQVKFMANNNQIFVSDIFNGYVYQLVETITRKKNTFFRITNATSSIGKAVFDGSGLNDLLSLGTYTGSNNRTYRVQIDGTSNPNTFKWSNDGGSTWQANNVAITGGDQLLSDGVEIIFTHTTGHTLNDFWDIAVVVSDLFFPPITPIYLDTYGIYIKSLTEIFYLSNSGDFSQISALDYASKTSYPDNAVCGISVNQEITFIGNSTAEIWYDTGASPFPLQKRPNLLINWGTEAPLSLDAASNNTLFWLAQSKNGGRVVIMMQNYAARIISDKALNDKLQEYENVQDAFGFVMEFTGRIFYFLTIPSADVTWVYDYNTSESLGEPVWSQRTTYRQTVDIKKEDYVEGRYLANCHVFHNGKHYIGDWQSGKIYLVDNTYYYDGTEPIINEGICAPLNLNLSRMSVYGLHIDFATATDQLTGQGSNPTVMLQKSKDGGISWSQPVERRMGTIGQSIHRCKWNKVGYARGMVFKVRTSDPTKKILLGARIEVENTGA